MKDLSASIHQKLLNKATQDNIPYPALLQYHAMERFLQRLLKSGHADKFVLKGGLLFWAWRIPFRRTTIDIDFYLKKSNSPEQIAEIFKEACNIQQEDGLNFDGESIRFDFGKNENILQFNFSGYLGEIRKDKKGSIAMRIDIGLDCIVFPKEQDTELPAVLTSEFTCLQGYTKESVIAEKFEAMTKNGIFNSRMKDFTDIYLLSKNFHFDGNILSKAIELILKHHHVEINENIDAFSDEFINLKQVDWKNHRNKLGTSSNGVPEKFKDIVESIKEFLQPLVKELVNGNAFEKNWDFDTKWK